MEGVLEEDKEILRHIKRISLDNDGEPFTVGVLELNHSHSGSYYYNKAIYQMEIGDGGAILWVLP